MITPIFYEIKEKVSLIFTFTIYDILRTFITIKITSAPCMVDTTIIVLNSNSYNFKLSLVRLRKSIFRTNFDIDGTNIHLCTIIGHYVRKYFTNELVNIIRATIYFEVGYIIIFLQELFAVSHSTRPNLI